MKDLETRNVGTVMLMPRWRLPSVIQPFLWTWISENWSEMIKVLLCSPFGEPTLQANIGQVKRYVQQARGWSCATNPSASSWPPGVRQDFQICCGSLKAGETFFGMDLLGQSFLPLLTDVDADRFTRRLVWHVHQQWGYKKTTLVMMPRPSYLNVGVLVEDLMARFPVDQYVDCSFPSQPVWFLVPTHM